MKIEKKEHKSPMSAAGGEVQQPDVKREEIRSAAFFSAYANDVQIQTTPWDLRLLFGEFTLPTSPEAPPVLMVNLLGEVRMSPSLAKKVTVIMLQQIKTYEERFGPIPLPKD